MAALTDTAQQLHALYPQARAVGVGSAGQIDHESGVVVFANENLPGWTGMNIRARLEAVTGLPAVVDNDVNVAALAEARLGAAVGKQVVLMVTIGTGIGGALVLGDRLFQGATGVAGEIGHMPLTLNGARCSCGKRGCLETYASGPRIATAYARAAGLERPVALPEVMERARVGDRIARRAFLRAGLRLGQALAGLVNALNPDAIVIGGGVLAAWELLCAAVQQQLERSALPAAAHAVTIEPAALGNEGGVLGAAILAHDALRQGVSVHPAPSGNHV
jgi:glucokinase